MTVGIRLPCFRLAAALRHLIAADTAVFLIDRGRRRVVEASDAAAYGGVRPGMALCQASRLLPRAAVVLEDPVRTARAWRRVLDVLAGLPAAVEDGGPGLAFLRIGGGERAERWFARVRAVLATTGLPVRCGAGANRFIAFVAAHRSADTVCPPRREPAFVADAPLELLCADDAMLLRLRLLGVRTLGELAVLPPAYVRRLGEDAARLHELAHGHDDERTFGALAAAPTH